MMLLLVFAGIWLLFLLVMERAKLYAWQFVWGSLGLFLIGIVVLRPLLEKPLTQCVSVFAGLVGSLTGTYTALFRYAVLYVPTVEGSMTVSVDFECSGVIELLAFLCPLIFFRLYKAEEKVVVGLLGACYMMLCNALRVSLICLAVHFMGAWAYFLFHNFVGRVFFYAAMVALYFYAFTKPQVLRTKVGSFSYDHSEQGP